MLPMTKKREGFRTLFTQLPTICWVALDADARARGESVAKRLTAILARHYKIKDDQIPKPKRAGRKPSPPS